VEVAHAFCLSRSFLWSHFAGSCSPHIRLCPAQLPHLPQHNIAQLSTCFVLHLSHLPFPELQSNTTLHSTNLPRTYVPFFTSLPLGFAHQVLLRYITFVGSRSPHICGLPASTSLSAQLRLPPCLILIFT
jgi:hypothetical protein